ncbi:MAG: hypothetical protein GKR94_04405 [Gammaproteobacteria bacterium]|nr:hypothetical protein [Gammaproteobacteria bacterium]
MRQIRLIAYISARCNCALNQVVFIGLLSSVMVPVHAATAVGRVQEASGDVAAVSVQRQERKVTAGAELFQGENIKTGQRSWAKLRFSDGTRFELSAQTEMRIDRLSLDDTPAQDQFKASVFRGVFRFFSGLIAKRRPRAMEVILPTATIGIRGTQVVGEVKGSAATVILLEPEGAERLQAIDVSNPFGSVTISQAGFGTVIPDANSPPSPPRRMRLNTIRDLMRTLQAVRRVPIPRIRRR